MSQTLPGQSQSSPPWANDPNRTNLAHAQQNQSYNQAQVSGGSMSTHIAPSHPLLDRKLRRTSKMRAFGQQLAHAFIAEARRQARITTATSGDSNGGRYDGESVPITVTIPATAYVFAEAGDKLVQVSVDTPAGRISVHV